MTMPRPVLTVVASAPRYTAAAAPSRFACAGSPPEHYVVAWPAGPATRVFNSRFNFRFKKS